MKRTYTPTRYPFRICNACGKRYEPTRSDSVTCRRIDCRHRWGLQRNAIYMRGRRSLTVRPRVQRAPDGCDSIRKGWPMELLFELVYVATGEPRNGIQEMLEPTEAQERNEYLKRAGNVYRWERVRQPHRDRD